MLQHIKTHLNILKRIKTVLNIYIYTLKHIYIYITHDDFAIQDSSPSPTLQGRAASSPGRAWERKRGSP